MMKEVFHLTVAILLALVIKNVIKSFAPASIQPYLA